MMDVYCDEHELGWVGQGCPLCLMANLRTQLRAAEQRGQAAVQDERKRAVYYLRVLKQNHPHLAMAYEHAAVNLEAALQTDWTPGALSAPPPGDTEAG